LVILRSNADVRGVPMQRGWLVVVVLMLVSLLAGCPSSSHDPDDARIEFFSVTPATVASGGTVVLAWRAVHSDVCFLQARVVGGALEDAVQVPCEGGESRVVEASTVLQFSVLLRDGVSYATRSVAVEVAPNGSTLDNVALTTRGATTGDNGHFDDGIHTAAPSVNAIDGDPSTYWAGLAQVSPQMIWVDFDRSYRISRIEIDELDVAFINVGLLEYFDGNAWVEIMPIHKSSAGFEFSFLQVEAAAVRVSVYDSTAPSGWFNQVACITSLRVYAIVDGDGG